MKTYSSLPGENENNREVNCNLCSSARRRFRMRVGQSVFVQCSDCGLVYQNPQPIFQDLKQRYQDEYFQYEINNEKNFFELMKLGLRDIGLDEVCPENFENKRFLDIGCATGMLCEFMQSRRWDSHGVDICGPSCEYGRKERQVKLLNLTLEEAAFPDKHFSLIHASHLIEHVINPFDFLNEVYRIMSDQGFGVFTTPNISGFQARLFGSDWRSAIEDHVYLFNIKTFSQLLKKCGFRIIQHVTWGGIAQGRAPLWLKKIMDTLAKSAGFGDVMLFYFQKA